MVDLAVVVVFIVDAFENLPVFEVDAFLLMPLASAF